MNEARGFRNPPTPQTSPASRGLPVTVAETPVQMSKTTTSGSSKPCYVQASDDWGSEWEDEDISNSEAAEEEDDDNPNEPRPQRIAAGGYAMGGDFHEKIFLKCMWCNIEIADRYRTCCDKFYCRKCAMSCCLFSARASYLLLLPEVRAILSQDMVVPVPLPPPEFPYFIHEGTNSVVLEHRLRGRTVNPEPLITHTFINWHDVRDMKQNVRAIEYQYNFDKEGNQIGSATSILDMRVRRI